MANSSAQTIQKKIDSPAQEKHPDPPPMDLVVCPVSHPDMLDGWTDLVSPVHDLLQLHPAPSPESLVGR